jgi:hypothetical protein
MRSMRLLLLLRSPRSLRCTIPCMAPTASGTQEGVLHRQHHTAKHVLTALQLFFAASLHRLNIATIWRQRRALIVRHPCLHWFMPMHPFF